MTARPDRYSRDAGLSWRALPSVLRLRAGAGGQPAAAALLWRDTAGNVLVEVTVMMTILFVFVLGGIDFLFAFYQYNAATKAVELGARIAAVWDPVAEGLNGCITGVSGSCNGGLATTLLSSNTAGSSMPWYKVVCDGSAQTCACTGTCTGVTGYDAAAMKALVYGRVNSGACGAGGSVYADGMCNIYPGLTPANVKITYQCGSSTTTCSLGYVGRPDGPVPTITVQLQNLHFTFYFLGGLLNFANITMPPLTTTITGEYMSSAAP